jgi:hypothetical protein
VILLPTVHASRPFSQRWRCKMSLALETNLGLWSQWGIVMVLGLIVL